MMIDWNPIPNFSDKAIQIHAVSGAIATFAAHTLSPSWVYILLAVTIVTTAKEVWAYLNPNKYQTSLNHAVATGIGGLLAFGATKLLF
jgi:hypothetical protein